MTDAPSMSPELWSEVVSIGHRRWYPAGSLLFAEGDAAGPVLAILSGSVTLTAGTDDGRIDELGPGELLGELSAVDGLPRSAAALALTDTEVLAVDQERFACLLVSQPRLALYLLRSVGHRLRRATTERALARGGIDLTTVASELLASHRSTDPATRRSTIPSLAGRFDVAIQVMSRVVDHLVERGGVRVDHGVVVVVDPILLGASAGVGDT